jgi:predicted RecA/RadA family phage recombinase
MAQGFLHTGFRAQIITASGAILKNAIVVQEGITGVAQTAIASGAAGWMGVEGVWNLPVPSSTVKGDGLYVSGSPASDSTSASLTRTATSNTLFGVAETSRDANGYAHVRLAQVTHQRATGVAGAAGATGAAGPTGTTGPTGPQGWTAQASPTATSAAIIAALQSAGVFL